MIIKMEIKIEDCMYCGNTGRTKEDPFKCSHCGREYRTLNRITKPILENVYIPERYRNDLWNLETYNEYIDKMGLNKKTFDNFKKWGLVLNLMLENLKLKKLSKIDFLYVSAGSNSGIRRWAYTFLSLGEYYGYKVSSIIDLNDIDLNNPDDNELIENVDILVLRLTNFKLSENLEKLNYIQPKRSNKDKCTVIITKMNYNFISSVVSYQTFDEPILIQRMIEG